MKQILKSVLAILAISTINYSCEKEYVPQEHFSPGLPSSGSGGGGGSSSMSTFFADNGVTAQNFTIDASQFETVTGNKGIELYFPPNAFVTQSGQAVTGNINIELKEVYTKEDIILTGISTTSNNMPLISGGMFYLKATQNGQELKLTAPNIVEVVVPAGNTPSFQMEEFYATSITSSNDTISDWVSTNPFSQISVIQDTGAGGTTGNYYYFTIDSMNWINCDYFWNDPNPRTTVKATVGDKFNNTNCVVFMSVDGINSVMQFYENPEHIYNGYNMPTGKAVTFIAVAKIGDQFYSDFASSTTVMNHNEIMDLQPTTLADIKAQLAILP